MMETQLEIPHELYKIVSIDNWKMSKNKGHIALDQADDQFIHFSTKQQIAGVAKKHWTNKKFALLKIDPTKLEGKLVLEYNSSKTDQYYHIYDGKIPLEAVVQKDIYGN